MSIRHVDFTRSFDKRIKKLPAEVKIALQKRLALFLDNPHHPLLRNHELTGNLHGKRSINVTGDWRAIYSEKESGVIVFELIGTHSMLYR